MADRKAKEAARMISVGLMSAPSEISLNDAKRISEDIAQRSWQRKWNEENTGRYTYNLIPYRRLVPRLYSHKSETLECHTAECYYMTLC